MPEQQLRIIRRRLFVTTLTLSVSVVVAFALAAAAFTIGHRNSRNAAQQSNEARFALCQVQNRSNKALRAVLLLAQKLVKKTRNIPPKEKLRGVEFYAQALRLVPHVNCTKLTHLSQN